MATSDITGVDFVALSVKDLHAASDFYGGTLGLHRSRFMPDRGFSEYETGNLTLGVMNGEQAGLGHRTAAYPIALHVDDVAKTRADLEAKGVEFAGDILDTGVCHMAFFHDPDGNPLMLHHRYAPRNPD
jgi:predicted enzyme related to lactoylglutathione lyase